MMRRSNAKMKNDMAQHQPRKLRQLLRCEKGVAALETAFALPLVLLMSLGILEMGYVMASTVLLEGAIKDASRTGMTGYVICGKTREEYINDLIKDRTFGMIDIDNMTITQEIYDSFGDVDRGEIYNDENDNGMYDDGEPFVDENGNGEYDDDIGAAGLGGSGAIVAYSIEYDASFMTGYFSRQIGDQDGRIQLKASTVIKNEPFGVVSQDCPA